METDLKNASSEEMKDEVLAKHKEFNIPLSRYKIILDTVKSIKERYFYSGTLNSKNLRDDALKHPHLPQFVIDVIFQKLAQIGNLSWWDVEHFADDPFQFYYHNLVDIETANAISLFKYGVEASMVQRLNAYIHYYLVSITFTMQLILDMSHSRYVGLTVQRGPGSI